MFTTAIQKNQWLNLRHSIKVLAHQRGLLYQGGQFVRVLAPGRYHFWRWEDVDVSLVGMRQEGLIINSQEMLTSDHIDIRLTLVVQYQVSDPQLLAETVENPLERLYQDGQLALRGMVATREMDALLNDRDNLSVDLKAEMAPIAEAYGIRVLRVGVKDIILPRAMRDAMQTEVYADRSGRADLIRARHEVAAIRARANGAKILAENPHLVRMNELEAVKNLAYGQGTVLVLPNIADILPALNRD